MFGLLGKTLERFGLPIIGNLTFILKNISKANILVVEWESEIRTSLYKWLPFCQKPFEIQSKTSGFQMVRFSYGLIAKA